MGLISQFAADNCAASQAAVSGALAAFCAVNLIGRPGAFFGKNAVIYDVGDEDPTLYFLRNGFVKIGTITQDGHEVIYDVRKAGDVIGELSVCGQPRLDRAVALEQTEAVPVPFREIVSALRNRPDLLSTLLEVFSKALTGAYGRINALAYNDTLHRLVKLFLELPVRLGCPLGPMVELPTYFTQEEISQMVAVRRERVSTALNSLRRQGAIHYSRAGRLVLNLEALKTYIE